MSKDLATRVSEWSEFQSTADEVASELQFFDQLEYELKEYNKKFESRDSKKSNLSFVSDFYKLEPETLVSQLPNKMTAFPTEKVSIPNLPLSAIISKPIIQLVSESKQKHAKIAMKAVRISSKMKNIETKHICDECTDCTRDKSAQIPSANKPQTVEQTCQTSFQTSEKKTQSSDNKGVQFATQKEIINIYDNVETVEMSNRMSVTHNDNTIDSAYERIQNSVDSAAETAKVSTPEARRMPIDSKKPRFRVVKPENSQFRFGRSNIFRNKEKGTAAQALSSADNSPKTWQKTSSDYGKFYKS